MTSLLRTAALSAAAALAIGLAGCDAVGIDDRPNPNGPALDDIINNPTEANLSNLAVGIEASARTGIGTYLVDTSVLGREFWRIGPSDPRFTEDLLGKGDAILDNNTFYIITPWSARYTTIRNANTMIVALDGNTTLSDAEKAAARGFAKTWKAYAYLLNLNLTYENGLRFIEPGEDEAGPIVGYDESLDRIAALFDEGYADLQAGSDFFFDTSIAMGIPGGADGYALTNRALAARVDAYREDWAGVLSALDDSFVDAGASLEAGAYHVFSNSAGDVTNPIYFPLEASGDATLAHPSYVDDIREGDERIDNVELRSAPRTFDGLTSAYDVDVYESPVSDVPIVRNEELLLLRAEANAQLGNGGAATDDIDVVRQAAGLDDYDGGEDTGSLVDEVLYNRRYSLYAEGHRWIDLRRYGRLDTLPIDRAGDDVFVQFPLPEQEVLDVQS